MFNCQISPLNHPRFKPNLTRPEIVVYLCVNIRRRVIMHRRAVLAHQRPHRAGGTMQCTNERRPSPKEPRACPIRPELQFLISNRNTTASKNRRNPNKTKNIFFSNRNITSAVAVRNLSHIRHSTPRHPGSSLDHVRRIPTSGLSPFSDFRFPLPVISNRKRQELETMSNSLKTKPRYAF